jgi:hypothetical protein
MDARVIGNDDLIHAALTLAWPAVSEGVTSGAEKLAKLDQGAAPSWSINPKLAPELIGQTSKEEDSHRLIPFRHRPDPSPML